MLDLNNIFVTHDNLRNKSSLEKMVSYVKNDGVWDIACLQKYSEINKLGRVSPLIQITKFEDGKLFTSDGHHRVVSCYLAGRYNLFESEYEIKEWTYEEYLELSHENSWYTPFDPRKEMRLPDYKSFKHQVKEKFLNNESADQILNWINSNKNLYLSERKIWTVGDLVLATMGWSAIF